VSTVKKSQDRIVCAWAVRNCFQVGPLRRGGVDAGPVEDFPNGAGRDPVAQADQLALNPAVSRGWVLGGQAQRQVPDLLVDRWPAGPGVGERPVPGDQISVPAQQGRWGDEERCPARAGKQPRQGGQQHPVGRLQVGAVHLSA
jgi:hypothetical protein